MENGMTISRWAQHFLGVHSTYWGWPDNSPLQASVIQSSSLNGSVFRSNNKTVYQNQLHKVGPTNSETSTALNRNLNEYNSSLSPNWTSAAQKGKTSTSMPKNGFQLVSHSANVSNFMGQGVSLGNSARNEENISSSPFASRFELKLGQPPNLINSSSKVINPTSLQRTTALDVQATHFSQPAVSKGLSSNENSGRLEIPQKEDSRLNQFLVNTIPTNTHPHRTSPSDDFTSDPSKNSLISLFLSHLERKNLVESGDDILGNGTEFVRGSDEKALDKCKNGFVRIDDENSNLGSNSNISRSGGFTCNVSDALRTCSPNSESLNLKHHGFDLTDNSWYKPERCARVCETTHLHGRMCCLSNLKFQNSSGQDNNNKTLHEEHVHKFQCGNHSDVCKFPVRCIPSCLVCSRERLSACCICDSEKPTCISSTHETLPTCGAHCISRCHKHAILLLEEDKDRIVGDTNKRPKLSSQCECSWKDAPGKNFLGKDFPLKDVPEKLFTSDKVISSISSGSSAPAVTEVSVETDKNLELGSAGMRVLVPVPADEASLVEKCGSSDERHEICTTIQPSLSATNKSSALKRERPVMTTDSLAKKPRNDVRLVKRDKKTMERVHYRPTNHSEINEVFCMESRKDKMVDQVHCRPEDRPGMNEANLEKNRNKKSVCLIRGGPAKRPRINQTFSEKKKVESMVDQVHHGSVTYSKTSEAFSEEREENSVALVHRRPMSCFNANGTFSEKNREDEVDPGHHGPMNHLEARKQPKYKYLSEIGIKESETKNKNSYHPFCAERNKPVVCGNFGIISNGMTNDALKPAKIVSLVSVLQRTKTSCDKFLQNKAEKLSPLAEENPRMLDLRKSMRLVHNNPMNSAVMVEPTLSRSARKFKDTKLNEFGEYSGKNKRVKMKSISLDIMEGEQMSKLEHSPKTGTGFVQEESNNVIHVSPSLSGGECQLFPASHERKSRHAEEHKHLSLSELSCSVCRSSTEEDINTILRCQHCTITVHQACYGILRQPKGPWFCRPCRAGFFDPVCVLCGYQGGAMTRALKPRKLVNSLMEYLHKPCFGRPSTQLNGADENRSMVHWVHMVCGLWTPSTRCPNVNTMASFDLSGTPSRKNSICSVCRRPGGSCVKCRISGCTIVFHPWCAHQKGLLQNEVEGEHDEKVGFYGRCIYHATVNKSDGENLYIEGNEKYASNEGWTCARTEVFKGQKRGQYENPAFDNIATKGDSRACIVSEEQINAWLRINGKKPFTDVAVKSLSSPDVELDLQKEYMRYKQLQGWKHLVVYKSRIHALGLYTSCFIPHGAMVVEYVGEIVRLRVADKREKEYQSGQKLHSKSACYFFRIDEENIIDATRKGGISRFVNHSCSANCVAKIISVLNEKKVVFIAERDINPGEEITYDYHFNPENEGEKIPCFCNSKNCRRFLN
ncbi:uncharacterized protein LOC144567629 isoform X3 [Carex rostrata]